MKLTTDGHLPRARQLATRAAQAESIAEAAQQHKLLARAEMRTAYKTFKRARKVARQARRAFRRAAAKAGRGAV